MYVVDRAVKMDLARFWALPDRVFFACGACQVLGHVATERYGGLGFAPKWLRPAAGFRGNHIIVTDGALAFDYHGWTRLDALLAHARRKAVRWWPGWTCDLVDFAPEALISEALSKAAGLHMRQPDQFLHNALPRAWTFLDRYPLPAWRCESRAGKVPFTSASGLGSGTSRKWRREETEDGHGRGDADLAGDAGIQGGVA